MAVYPGVEFHRIGQPHMECQRRRRFLVQCDHCDQCCASAGGGSTAPIQGGRALDGWHECHASLAARCQRKIRLRRLCHQRQHGGARTGGLEQRRTDGPGGRRGRRPDCALPKPGNQRTSGFQRIQLPGLLGRPRNPKLVWQLPVLWRRPRVQRAARGGLE